MNEVLSPSCFDQRIFPFSESVFSFQNDTITKKGALLFFFSFSKRHCLLCNDFLICTLPRCNYWKEKQKLLGMSCYAKLRIISSYFLCDLFD